MPASHSLTHRRAIAAHLRRQTGFDPTAIFGPALPDITSIFPNLPLPGLPGSGNGDDDTTTPALPLPLPTTTGSSTPSSLPSTALPTSATGTTSSTPSVVPTTTAAVPPPVVAGATPTTNIVTGQPQTTFVTKSLPSTPTTSTPTSTNTNISGNNDASEGISTGAVVGGIGAGIVAIAAIGFAAAYFVRRAKRKESTEDTFDPTSFRRSAVLLNDPRPPSMIENRPGASTNYGAGTAPQGEYPYPDHSAYGAANFQSFAPGQVVGANTYPQQQHQHPSPFAPASPYPYYNETEYYSQVPPMNTANPGMGMVGNYPALTRQPSAPGGQYPYPQGQPQYHQHQQQYSPHPSSTGHDLLPPEPLPAGDYVDLNRSSVSPFQAQQYAEISRRLNTDLPMGQQEVDRELPPVPPKSPMEAADPFASTPPSPGVGPSVPVAAFINPRDPTVLNDQHQNQHQHQHDDRYGAPGTRDMEFPIPPPSPVLSVSRYGGGSQRVESMPPVLNLNLENRPMSFGVGVGAGAAGVGGGPVLAHVTPMPKSSPLAQQQEEGKKRAVSVYDADDAYGGF